MQIYNSLTKRKEEFEPLDGKTVRIYACGPTPYDMSHIGHARVYIVWDVICRYLRQKGYAVTYVRNVTDIEDKIINKAKEESKRPEQIARKYLFEFWRDMQALNTEPPDIEPRATEFLLQMIYFVQGLITNGKAYQSGGDVYFDVQSAEKYGQLTKQALKDMMAGSREQVMSQAELKERKRHPADFALWKGAGNDETGWTSPWGFGRPGWHLECSTMIKHVLGETIDLHGGGEDLLFPHHENEIAQSEGLHSKPLARFWVHNSFVQVNSEKMSKSLGNFTTIRELLKLYTGDDIRLFILQTHYRNPIDFSPEGLGAAKTAMQRLIRAVHGEAATVGNGGATFKNSSASNSASASNNTSVSNSASASNEAVGSPVLFQELDLSDPDAKQFHIEFMQAMENDFNTAVAVSLLFALVDAIGTTKNKAQALLLVARLKYYAYVLGFTLTDTRQDLKPETSRELMSLILHLRSDLKKKQDYATADLIRKSLTECGINVMDLAQGSTWESS